MQRLLGGSLQRWGPLLSPPPLWERHYQEQEERWARHDGLASSLALLALVAAALRVGAHLSLPDMAMHLLLVAVALAVMQGGQRMTPWRNAAVAFLRLGFALSSVLQKHALMVLEDKPADGSPALVNALQAAVRLLVGDHTFLLAFLGIGWPLGTLSNALLQLVCFAVVAQRNQAICNAPFMHAVSAKELAEVRGTLVQRHAQDVAMLPLPDEKQICMWHTIALQLLLGYAAPILYQTRIDVRAALAHAERHGIPANDRLHRTFRWLNRYVSSATPLLFILASSCVAVGVSSALLHARGGK